MPADAREREEGEKAGGGECDLCEDGCVVYPRESLVREAGDEPGPGLIDGQGEVARSIDEPLTPDRPRQDLVGEETCEIRPRETGRRAGKADGQQEIEREQPGFDPVPE